MKIVLLEPDHLLGHIYKSFFEQNGHKVQWSKNAQSALKDMDKVQPEVIIVELQLVKHNGIEFLYEIRSYPEWQNIPAIILSNVPPVSLDVSPVLFRKLNVINYLYKPGTKLSEMLETVELAPVAK